jgi:hypothetical protein
MLDYDRNLENLDFDHRRAAESIVDAAGTSDADWNVLEAAAKLLVEARRDRDEAVVELDLLVRMNENCELFDGINGFDCDCLQSDELSDLLGRARALSEDWGVKIVAEFWEENLAAPESEEIDWA